MAQRVTTGILTYNFAALQVNLDFPQERTKEITAPGADGVAFMKTGRRAEPGTAISRSHLTSGQSPETFMVNYAALSGQVVSMEDDHGDTYPFLVVRSVRKVDVIPCLASVPVGITKILIVEWTIHYSQAV